VEKIMETIKEEHCKDCISGEAYDVLHYESYGTSIDHNFVENQVPVSTCWEIYGDNTGLGLNSHLSKKYNQKMRHQKMKFLSRKA